MRSPRLVACSFALLCGSALAQLMEPDAAVPPAAPVPEGATTAPPLWEAGLALVALRGPDYPAAGAQQTRAALLPFAVYRGKRWRLDDEGARGRLVHTSEFELDLSAGLAFDAPHSDAREGMPSLDYTFELGPQAVYRLNLDGGQQVSGHLQARAVFSADGHGIKSRGFLVEPELRWRLRGWPSAGTQWQLGLQATWASEGLQDYFYQVDPAYQTSTRAAYDAKAGYLGAALRGGWSQRLSSTLLFSLGLSLNQHSGAANEDSPLFEKRHTTTATAALIWTPWRGGTAGEP